MKYFHKVTYAIHDKSVERIKSETLPHSHMLVNCRIVKCNPLHRDRSTNTSNYYRTQEGLLSDLKQNDIPSHDKVTLSISVF